MSENSLFLQPFSRFSRSAGTGGLLCQASQRGSRQTFQSGQNGLEFPLLFGGGFIKRRRFRGELNVDGLAVDLVPVSYTHLRAHETRHDLVCRLLLEKKKKK